MWPTVQISFACTVRQIACRVSIRNWGRYCITGWCLARNLHIQHPLYYAALSPPFADMQTEDGAGICKVLYWPNATPVQWHDTSLIQYCIAVDTGHILYCTVLYWSIVWSLSCAFEHMTILLTYSIIINPYYGWHITGDTVWYKDSTVTHAVWTVVLYFYCTWFWLEKAWYPNTRERQLQVVQCLRECVRLFLLFCISKCPLICQEVQPCTVLYRAVEQAYSTVSSYTIISFRASHSSFLMLVETQIIAIVALCCVVLGGKEDRLTPQPHCPGCDWV